jgi:hypothetical protein
MSNTPYDAESIAATLKKVESLLARSRHYTDTVAEWKRLEDDRQNTADSLRASMGGPDEESYRKVKNTIAGAMELKQNDRARYRDEVVAFVEDLRGFLPDDDVTRLEIQRLKGSAVAIGDDPRPVLQELKRITETLLESRSEAGTDPQSPEQETQAPPSLAVDTQSEKGDIRLLQRPDGALCTHVNLKTAERYAGIGRRQRQKLMKDGTLRTVGSRSNRRVSVESLTTYCPPKNHSN